MQNLVGKLLVESLFLTRDQALSLWSGSTDSKTLDYQRTNLKGFQIVRTHTKLGRMKELGGKTGVLVGLDLPSSGGGTEAGVGSPHWGNCLSQRRNI